MREHLPEPVRRVAREARRRAKIAARWRHKPDPMPTCPPPRPDARARLLIGPANFAGQGWEWARAIDALLPDASAVNLMVQRDRLQFQADYVVTPEDFRNPWWQRQQTRDVTRGFTHVLSEAAKPVLGTRYANDVSGDAKVLPRKGIRMAFVAHGSDARLPSRHAELYPYSPFRDADDWEVVPVLERNAARFIRIYEEQHAAGRPVFCTTPDLLDDLPFATLLPVVVEVDRWTTDAPVMERERPRVLHAPAVGRIKGSEIVEPVLHRLHDEGVIEYVRLKDIAPEDMPAHVAGCDMVLDQLSLGIYGAISVEALAARRIVLSHVHDRNRARLPEDPPIVEIRPDTLEDVVRGLVADRAAARAVAERGPAYARAWHDGRYAVSLLAPWLGVDVPEAVLSRG